MQRIKGSLPSPAMVVAVLALIAAVAGTGYAASQVDSRDVENNSLKSNDLKNDAAVKSKDVVDGQLKSVDVKDAGLTGADLADNTVTGAKIDEATVGPVGGDQRFSFNLSFGASQQIATYGVFTLTAQCLQNTTDNGGTANRDVARIILATNQNGAVFRSNQDDKAGNAAAEFLNTDTPPTDSIVAEASAPTGTGLFDDNEDLSAIGPDGTKIVMANEVPDLAVNLFGQNCLFQGEITKLNQ